MDMEAALVQALRADSAALADFLVSTRRDLHQNPELGNQERRTAAMIVAALADCGCEIRERVGGTGVVATLRGARPGRTLALRADMDALPLHEESDHPYRSRIPGCMHACGHDGHVAMLLGAARVLGARRPTLPGNVKFVFQPAEETVGGASAVIADGGLRDDPPADAIFGLHLWPDGPLGQLALRSGSVMASADALRIVVQGQGGHAGEPHNCLDPVPVAAHIITGLQTLVTRGYDANNPVVVTITYLRGGEAFNVIPPEAVLAGTVRTVDPAVRAAMPKRIEALAQHTAQAFGATAEVAYIHGSGVVVNHAAFTDFVAQTITRTRGAAAVTTVPHPVMGAEDFGLYLEQVPGAFAFLGAWPTHQNAFPCHHPRFDFDERVLPIGVEILATVALNFLEAGGILS